MVIIMDNPYNKSYIYKIISPHINKIYIGSTTKNIKTRLKKHILQYKYFLKGMYRNVSSFELIKLGDCDVELIKECNFNSRRELIKEEFNIINQNIDNVVNIRIKCYYP